MAMGAATPASVWRELADTPEAGEALAYEAYRQRREAKIASRHNLR